MMNSRFAAWIVLLAVGWTPLLRADDVAALIRDLDSSDSATRIRAAATLGEFGAEAKPAVPHLAKALGVADTAFQHEILLTLGRLGPDARGSRTRTDHAIARGPKDIA